jgi:hypothetical protein
MDQEFFVPMQAVLALAVVSLVVLACGHGTGLPLVVVSGVGILVWLGFALPYWVRTRAKRDADRRREDLRALLCGVCGFVIPMVVAIVVWRSRGFEGVLFQSSAAAFAGVLLAVIPMSILASSMVDWYLTVPFLYGLLGPAVWQDDSEGLTLKRRRRIAKIWVSHRVICEILVYFSFALFLAIVFTAIGNAVSDDKTLPVAIESLGGSSIAVGVLAYLGPHVRHGLNYVLAENAGLGTWASGTDNYGETTEGFVVDVSVYPGVKLMKEDKELRFVPLEHADRLHEVEDRRPAQCDAAWRKAALRLGRKQKKPDPPKA